MALKKISQLAAAGALTGDELFEVSQPSATITITAATISAQGSDNSYNDTGSGFVAAGFAVGDNVRVRGFTGNAANNIFSARITALTSDKMTIGGTDGDVIVDDAAGESVTITKWVSRRIGRSALSAAPLITEGGTSRNMSLSDSGCYVRFVAAGAKTANFNSVSGFSASEEYNIANRAPSGDLTLVGTGVVLGAPKAGTLVLAPGDSVTVKFLSGTSADVIGSVVAA